MDKILVSSITPCFRMKPYLKRFLDELPKQTIFNQIEIVLDHNEPDEEEISWVKDFQQKYPGRIKHIIVPKVEPIGNSMNRCINESNGELLTIWNVDDLRTPNSLELQLKLLQENPDVGVAYGDYKVVRSFGATEGSIVHDEPIGEETTRSMIIGPFLMFRKNLIEKTGLFDESLKSGADFDLAIRLGFHTKAKMVNGLIGYYLNEGKGASTRPGSLQSVERTVIELRYGIFDKIDYDLVSRTVTYSIPYLTVNGEKVSVSNFVPKYKELIDLRREKWLKKGMRKFILQKVTFYKPIRAFLVTTAKKILQKIS